MKMRNIWQQLKWNYDSMHPKRNVSFSFLFSDLFPYCHISICKKFNGSLKSLSHCKIGILLPKLFWNFMKWGLKGGISIDADSGPPRYVLWCCGGICHEVLTFIQIGCGHTVINSQLILFWNQREKLDGQRFGKTPWCLLCYPWFFIIITAIIKTRLDTIRMILRS